MPLQINPVLRPILIFFVITYSKSENESCLALTFGAAFHKKKSNFETGLIFKRAFTQKLSRIRNLKMTAILLYCLALLVNFFDALKTQS